MKSNPLGDANPNTNKVRRRASLVPMSTRNQLYAVRLDTEQAAFNARSAASKWHRTRLSMNRLAAYRYARVCAFQLTRARALVKLPIPADDALRCQELLEETERYARAAASAWLGCYEKRR